MILTEPGRRVALEVLRHHRLLELLLAQELRVLWERVHAEAEVLEHALSEELEQRIAARLGDPTHDPHGDPIPSAMLELTEPDTVSLDALHSGQRATFVRVSDSEPEILHYLRERDILPGATLEVVDRQPFGGPLFVRIALRDHVLGAAIARTMRVELQR